MFDDIPGELEGVGAGMTLIGCLLPALHEMSMIVFEKKRISDAEGGQPFDDDGDQYQEIEDDSSCHYESEVEVKTFSDSHGDYSL